MSDVLPVPLPLLLRLAAIAAWLADCVDALTGKTKLNGGLEIAVVFRLRALAARLRNLAAGPARVRAREAIATPPARRRPSRIPPVQVPGARPTSPADLVPDLLPRLQRRFAWLLWLVPQLAPGRLELERMLADPECLALLHADPRVGPLLRPLCWMLGIHPSLTPPPRPRHALPALAAPEAEPADPAAADPLGIDPLGIDPLATDPLGADPLGADPTPETASGPDPGTLPPAPPWHQPRHMRIDWTARDLITQLRMGPSPYRDDDPAPYRDDDPSPYRDDDPGWSGTPI